MSGARPAVAALAAFLVAANASAAPATIKVAVIDIRSNGTDDVSAKTLTDVLVVEVAKVPGVSVVSDAELANLLSLEQRKQMVGCDEDASCAAEIAGALGVDKICSGSLGKLEATQVLTLRLIDVKTAKTERRVFEPVEGGAAKFIGRMPALVAQLFPDRVAAPAPPPPASSSSTQNSSSAVSLGGLLLYDPSPIPQPSAQPAAPPPPKPQPQATPAVAPNREPLGSPWVWLAAGGVSALVGLAWAGVTPPSSPDDAFVLPAVLVIAGVTAVVASPVLCAIGTFGSGDGLEPLDSPFAVPDSAPDRRVSVISVPPSP